MICRHYAVSYFSLSQKKTPAFSAEFPGDDPCAIATTTPRPTKPIRAPLADPNVVATRDTTAENRVNLGARLSRPDRALLSGTRLGRQELHAKLPRRHAGCPVAARDRRGNADEQGTEPPVAKPTPEGPACEEQLMEEVCARGNLVRAWKRVRSNKGGPGGDGMTIVEAGLDHGDLGVVRHQQVRHTSDRLEGPDVRADPIGERLGLACLGIGEVGGAQQRDEAP
jgi:hypothetical protein